MPNRYKFFNSGAGTVLKEKIYEKFGTMATIAEVMTMVFDSDEILNAEYIIIKHPQYFEIVE